MSKVAPTIRVQTILFRNDKPELDRALEALVNSLEYATGKISSWTIAFGDSSPEPVFLADEIDLTRSAIVARGGLFDYQFFNENLGHGGGHNRLHESASEDLLLILNPDGILAPDTISRLIDALKPGVGIVDARQLPMEHPKHYDARTGDTSWCSLACGLTTSEVFREVGGIDHETFFMYCDDVDFSWRVRLAGWKAKYCPGARMFHDKRIDVDGNFIAGETERYYSAEAALLLAYKYSRNDIVESLASAMSESEDPNLQTALAEFNRRLRDGLLPAQIDAKRRVAEFERGNYGTHRF